MKPLLTGRRLLLALAAALPLTVLAQAPAARAPMNPPVKIKVGTFKSSVDVGPALASTGGYFKQEGIDVEFVPFANSGEAMQALALGQIDALPGPVNAGLFNMLARKIPVKIVASAGSQQRGYGTIALVLREDIVKGGRYKGPADLKNLKISIPGRTSPAHFFVKELAAKGGLSLKDLNLVHLGLPEGLPAMANKSIDGVSTIEPFVAKTVAEAPGVRVTGMDEVLPDFPAAYLMYSPDFAKRVEPAQRFMVGYLKGLRDYNQAFGPQKRNQVEVLKALNGAGIALSTAGAALGTDPEGKPSFAGVDAFANWLVEEGTVKEKVDLRSYVDDRYREAALQALRETR